MTSLSEKIKRVTIGGIKNKRWKRRTIAIKDVREAVLRLKKKFNDAHFDKGIEEIFGEKLT